MKYIKHFLKVAKWMTIRAFCKHLDFRTGSCPFTMLTYTTCNKCGKRLDIQPTNENNPAAY